ncbi:unnamed protein product [Echinostoma caproni]|uniref:Pecanex-like protein n=1 Tax=Echinostoma caproni TaxID=27848 RepID=A0A183AZZ7_9TREM|nr:unnamed protein product [Echinostoma caproni]
MNCYVKYHTNDGMRFPNLRHSQDGDEANAAHFASQLTNIERVDALCEVLLFMAAQGHSPRSIILASIAYFLSAITIVLACVITFFWLRRLKFVRYYAAVRNKGCIEIYAPENNGTHDADMDHGENEKFTSIHKGSSTSSTTPDVDFCNPSRNGENSSAVNLEDLNTVDTTTPESTLPAISAEKLETHSLIRASETPVTDSRTNDLPAGDVQVLRNCFGICCFSRPTGVQRCRAYWSRYVTCFRECWPHCLSVWSVFFCSLSAFPAIQSMVKPVDSNFFISRELSPLPTYIR